MSQSWRTRIRSWRDPLQIMKALALFGALFVAYTVIASLGGKPKPWETDGPRYLVGEMRRFERSFPSRPMPDIVLMSDSEHGASLRDLADGRVLVVNLWATWCAPCLEELPTLEALQQKLSNDVQVVLVAMEPGDGTAQRAMLERLGVNDLLLLRDARLKLGRAYSENLTLPLTVIYDRRGREVGTLTGAADWSSPEAVRLVNAISAGALPS